MLLIVACLSSVLWNVGPVYFISYTGGGEDTSDGKLTVSAAGSSLVMMRKCCDERFEVVNLSMQLKISLTDLSLGYFS